MPVSSFLFYFFGSGVFTALLLTVSILFPDRIPWPLWVAFAGAYTAMLRVLWKHIQIWWFGPRLVIDITKYRIPEVCPFRGTPATIERFVEYHATAAVGPLHITQTKRFPVLLSEEGAAIYDKARFFKKIDGLTLRRVAYNKFYLHCKNDAYRRAILDANAETRAVWQD